jgi:GTP-binding protein
MSKLIKVAIVGRPNVGKSALFNKISKKRIAIIDEAEGITRDRLYTDTDLFGFPFRLIDTGGIDPRSKATFNSEIKQQAEIAIEEADAIIMAVDGTTGVTILDQEVAKILLRTKKPLVLAVNKIDNLGREDMIYPFHQLGIKDIIGVSAIQAYNIAELLEITLKSFPRNNDEVKEESGIKISIIGRPNVGKSSLVNTFLDDDRCIVSPIPGTTRDSIDISFEHENELCTLIDTAGIRRKKAEKEVVDKFAAIRTERAIERCDVAVLMLDVEQGLTTQDKRIAQSIEEEGKACIILFNKWDLVKGIRMEHVFSEIEEEVPFLRHCPKLIISTKTQRNLEKIIPLAKLAYQSSRTRITTHQLNKVVEKAMQVCHPPRIKGKRLRIYYMTQVDIQPPSLVLFVNSPQLMTHTYQRYIYNQIREKFPFAGAPLKIHLKGKSKERAKKAQLECLSTT